MSQNRDELIHWIELQPDLKEIRKQAESSLCEYKPNESSLQARITVQPRDKLHIDRASFLQTITSTMWIPKRALRGKFYSSPELDSSLGSVAKVASISTLWDFFTTLPIFFFAASFVGSVFGFLFALVIGYFVLWASNAAGENSTNASAGNRGKAKASIIAFLVLSIAKTAVSGVGTDLILSQNAISETFAATLIQQQQKEETSRLSKDSRIMARQQAECQRAEDRLAGIDRGKQPRRWESEYVRAYGTYADGERDRGLTPEQILKKYGTNIPSCKYVKTVGLINAAKFEDSQRDQALSTKDSKRGYLIQKYPQIYGLYFRGTPEGVGDRWHVEGNKAAEVPKPEFAEGKFRWADGSTAIEQATTQFFAKLVDPNKVASLGFSLFTFAISVILSGTATVMLYLTSKDKGVRASFSPIVAKKSNEILSSYQGKRN